MGAVAAAALAARKQRELMDRFTQAGATTPGGAKSLDELGIHPDGRLIRSFQDRGVIRDAGAGRYYFDVDAFHTVRKARLRIAFLVAGIVFIAGWIIGVMATSHR